MFNSLQDKLDKALHNISGRGKITEINVAETVKEIRRALVDADVNYKVAKDLTKRVQDKALGQNVLTSLTPGQLMTKIVHDELVDLMGGTQEGINLSGKPSVILIAGLQGSGKTTFSGKLANHLKQKKNKKPLLVACDVYRPAAIQQLKILGEQTGIPVYTEEGATNPSTIGKSLKPSNSSFLNSTSSVMPESIFWLRISHILSANSLASRQSCDENKMSFWCCFAKSLSSFKIAILLVSSKWVVGSSKIMRGEFCANALPINAF